MTSPDSDPASAAPPGRRAGTVSGRHFLRGLVFGALLCSAALGLDWLRAPEDQLSARAALRFIETYQRTASPHMDRFGVTCRFVPTCSHYGHAVIEEHGLPRGAFRAAGRIVRCGPWTPAGTVDPP